MRRVKARVAHEIPNRAPLRLEAGQRVRVGERDTTWPEFVLVTAEHGTGWVPARHLSTDEGEAEVVAAYDTQELPTTEGEILDVLGEDRVSGWLWCRSDSGRQGWVPIKTVVEGP